MTRKFLTPIVLPADPVAAMEAATKQYVDAQAGGGGTDEVWVGPDDPGGTLELWYDTDDVGAAAPQNLWATAWGQLASKTGTGDVTVSTTPPSKQRVMADTPVSLVAGRRYRIRLQSSKYAASSSLGADVVLVYATINGTQVGGSWWSSAATYDTTGFDTIYDCTASGTYTLAAYVERVSGGTSVTFAMGWMYVDDVGPVTPADINGVLTAGTNAWNTAWGEVAYSTMPADVTGITGTAVTSLGTTVTFTPTAGRRYIIEYGATIYSTADQDVAVLSVNLTNQAGVGQAQARFITGKVGGSTVYEMFEYSRDWIDPPYGTSTTLMMCLQRSGAATGTFTVLARANNIENSFIRVRDEGPSTPAPPTIFPASPVVAEVHSYTWTNGIGNQWVDMATSVTFTALANHRYRAAFQGMLGAATAANGAFVDVALRNSANTILQEKSGVLPSTNPGYNVALNAECFFTKARGNALAAGSVTLKLSGITGNGTVNSQPSSPAAPNFIVVEDLGYDL